MNLAEAVLAGERLALARLITLVENHVPEGISMLDALFPYTGKAHMVGVTGAPGTGKSSLVNQLAKEFRKLDLKVAIVAVDPSSPFTGGAILGDRVRMNDLSGDRGVFIRSMAARGTLGGLARTTASVVQVLDAAGFDVILVETVGVGQSEVDIARLAHTTVLVEAPGLGDDIQAIKAGILEIADVLVVNKSDLPGADNTVRSLRAMLELGYAVNGNHPKEGVEYWVPPILQVAAVSGSGLENLMKEINRHGEYLMKSGEWQKRVKVRLKNELESSLATALRERWQTKVTHEYYEMILEQLNQRQLSPFQAVEILVRKEENG